MEEDYFERDIRGWCGYCKNEIRADEDYIVIDNTMYHLSCNEIRNKYYDNFDIAEEG